ncbi:MAG: glycosyltransferase, partial [Candidatus Hodarchaeota archaeon]
MLKSSPLVSIIIPAFNEEAVIGRLLKSISTQSYSRLEVLIVDDGSTDKTVKIARKYTDKVFERRHAERSVQRNFGAKRAKGKYLLFLDADMELEKGVVKECVEKMESDKRIGSIVIPEKSVAKTFWEKVKAYERSFYNLEGDSTTDAARFFSKEAFKKAGGYDETITGPEDWDLPETVKNLGYKIGRVKAKINHFERIPSLRSLLKKKYYYALKSHRYLSKHDISPVGPKTIYFLRP